MYNAVAASAPVKCSNTHNICLAWLECLCILHCYFAVKVGHGRLDGKVNAPEGKHAVVTVCRTSQGASNLLSIGVYYGQQGAYKYSDCYL